MIIKLDILSKFHDYSDEFREDKSNTIRRLKILYPTPANLTDDENLFIIMWGKDSFPLLSYLRSKLNNTEKTNNYLEFYNHINMIILKKILYCIEEFIMIFSLKMLEKSEFLKLLYQQHLIQIII